MQKLIDILRFLIKILLDIRVIYALGGFIMSIVAHEVFHILMHLDTITGITFFPDNHAIISISTSLPADYDLGFEEEVAYSITALILLITIIDVFAIHDSRDKRTSKQMLSSRQKIVKLHHHARAKYHHSAPWRHFIHLFLITLAVMPVAAVLTYVLR